MAIDTDLALLAQAYGLELAYVNDALQTCPAAPDSVLAVLRALGAPVARAADAADALRQRRLDQWRRVLDPVVVAWDGRPADARLRLPATGADRPSAAWLELESGEVRALSSPLADRVPERMTQVEGIRFHEHHLPLPGPLPLGYHRLVVEVGAGRHEALVVAAPTRAHGSPADPPQWGAFLPLYALRSAGDCGVGDFTALQRLLAWVRQRGGALVGTLPLMAAFVQPAEKLFEPSPYSPASRLFWNEIFLDLEAIPELARAPAARARLESAEFRREAAALRGLPLVDYRRVMALKRSVLELLADEFFARPGPRGAEFQSYLAAHPRAEDYARFRAACERHGASWWCWPERQRDGDLRPGDYDERVAHYHLFAQWQADAQLAAAAVAGGRRGLYLDLPLGSSSDSYDIWRERGLFAFGVSAGAPPDGSANGGQDWGFPPLHPERLRESGYGLLREVLANLMPRAALLRIDHSMWLHRLYLIPNGADARRGVYVRFPADELYAVFCLESHRHGTRLIGEDIGIVPPEAGPTMDRHNIDHLYLAQYQYRPRADGSAPPVPANAVAGMSTHDLAPFAAFWRGLDLDERLELGLIDAALYRLHARDRDAVRAVLPRFLFPTGVARRQLQRAWGRAARVLRRAAPGLFRGPWWQPRERAVFREWLAAVGASAARVVLVNLEDLWLSPGPQNVPGTTTQRPNWRRRAAHALEEFPRMPAVAAALQALAAARDRAAAARKAA